jgi:arabinose-5-phosphate isomerase
VAGRLALSLRSIGIRASFVHGSEWVHGDLGVAGAGDVAVLLSHSGRTPELVDTASHLAARGVHVASITGDDRSPLAQASGLAHLLAHAQSELLGAVPTRSVVAQEAVVNGLLAAVVEASGLTAGEFRRHHPGGAIGGRGGT